MRRVAAVMCRLPFRGLPCRALIALAALLFAASVVSAAPQAGTTTVQVRVSVGKPRILFMVAEQAAGGKGYAFWWSRPTGAGQGHTVAGTVMMEAFLKNGYDVVDVTEGAGVKEIPDAYRVAEPGDEGARSAGRVLNAQVVIIGTADATEVLKLAESPVATYMASVAVRAMRVDNGAIIAVASGRGTSRNVSAAAGGQEALARAAQDATQRLLGLMR